MKVYRRQIVMLAIFVASVGCGRADFASQNEISGKPNDPSVLGPFGYGQGSVANQVSDVIMVLEKTNSASLEISGAASIVTNKRIVVNSTHSSAVVLSGAALIKSPSVKIAGDYRSTGAVIVDAKVETQAMPESDPFEKLPAPDRKGLTVRSGGFMTGLVTLEPGVYQGPVTVGGLAKVQLKPGIYVFEKGLEISAAAELKGEQVLLYLAGGELKISGAALLKLSPAASGEFEGVTIVQARDNTNRVHLSGAGVTDIKGAIYVPAASVELSGAFHLGEIGAIVVNRLQLSGAVF